MLISASNERTSGALCPMIEMWHQHEVTSQQTASRLSRGASKRGVVVVCRR